MCKYIDIANALKIETNDIILLSSDISLMSYEALEENTRFNTDDFINVLIDKIGKNGTLLLPVYNWGFCSKIAFDYHKTVGKTGRLGNAALKRDDFKRTKNPIYSFAVWGKDKDYLCSLDPVISLGKGSVFEYLHKNNAKNVVIDVHFNDHYTICHYVEQIYGVPYRYNKYFKADYIDEYGRRSEKTYSMSVRYLELDVKGDASALYDEFIKQKIAVEEKLGNHIICYIDIAKSVDVIKKDILEDNAKLQVQYNAQFQKKLSTSEYKEEIKNTLKNKQFVNCCEILTYIKNNYLGELNITDNNGYVLINGFSSYIITIVIDIKKLLNTEDYATVADIIMVIKYIYALPVRNYIYEFRFEENENTLSVFHNNNPANIKHHDLYNDLILFINQNEADMKET